VLGRTPLFFLFTPGLSRALTTTAFLTVFPIQGDQRFDAVAALDRDLSAEALAKVEGDAPDRPAYAPVRPHPLLPGFDEAFAQNAKARYAATEEFDRLFSTGTGNRQKSSGTAIWLQGEALPRNSSRDVRQ
jgi:hypothetical protein